MSTNKHALVLGVTMCALAAGAAQAQSSGAAQAPESLEEITVTSFAASLHTALETKKDAMAVVDSIAAEDLGKFPSANIAEALQRIPGVAIDRNAGQGRYVTIRGLGPAFNNVLLNGRHVTSEDGGREFS